MEGRCDKQDELLSGMVGIGGVRVRSLKTSVGEGGEERLALSEVMAHDLVVYGGWRMISHKFRLVRAIGSFGTINTAIHKGAWLVTEILTQEVRGKPA